MYNSQLFDEGFTSNMKDFGLTGLKKWINNVRQQI